MDIFHFKGYSECDSTCGMSRHDVNGKIIFIATDAEYSTGTSVTNAIEMIATELINVYGVRPDQFTLIEEIPHSKARYSSVSFAGGAKFLHGQQLLVSSPRWKHLNVTDFEQIMSGDFSCDYPDCGGDDSAGIFPCPLFVEKDISNGNPTPYRCQYNAMGILKEQI